MDKKDYPLYKSNDGIEPRSKPERVAGKYNGLSLLSIFSLIVVILICMLK